MCLDCGCGEPSNSHGEEGHLLAADLKRAAKVSGISVQKAAQNILDTVKAKMAEPMPKLRADFGRVIRASEIQAVLLHFAGDPEHLASWYESGADGQISWGSHGDFQQCVSVAGKYLSDPEGYCQLRHIAAVGGPAGSEDKK
jgi:hypothetical protein